MNYLYIDHFRSYMLKMKMKYSMVMRMKNINFRIYTKKNTMTIFHYRQHSSINSKSMYSVQTCFRTRTWCIFILITSAGYYIDYNRFLNILGISNVWYISRDVSERAKSKHSYREYALWSYPRSFCESD